MRVGAGTLKGIDAAHRAMLADDRVTEALAEENGFWQVPEAREWVIIQRAEEALRLARRAARYRR
jgi:hypothetical protein